MKTVRFLTLTAMAGWMVCFGLSPVHAQEDNPYNDPNLRWVPGFQLQGGRIGVGNLRLLAGAGALAEYNDNIYYASGEPGNPDEVIRHDWIGHFLSALFLDKVFEGRGGMRLGYQGDWAYYDEYTENDWKNHVGRFDLDYFAPGGLIARIRSSAAQLEDPYGNANQFALGVPKTKRWVYDAETRIGYRFSDRFRVLLLGSGFKQDYDEDRDFTQNWEEWTGGLSVEARLMPKTWAFVRYSQGAREYVDQRLGVTSQNQADFDTSRVTGGLEWDPGAKIQGEIDVGYLWLDYTNEFDPSGVPYADKHTWVANIAVNFFPRGRPPFEARETSVLTLNAWRAFRSVASNTSDFFTETGLSGVVRQEIAVKWMLRWGIDYFFQDYRNPQDEEAGNARAAIELMYKIQPWLSLSAGYDWAKKNSTVNVNDFEVKRVLITLAGSI